MIITQKLLAQLLLAQKQQEPKMAPNTDNTAVMLNRWANGNLKQYVRRNKMNFSREHSYVTSGRGKSRMYSGRGGSKDISALRAFSTTLAHRIYSLRESTRVADCQAPLDDRCLVKAYYVGPILHTIHVVSPDMDINVKKRHIKCTKLIHTNATHEALRWTANFREASVVQTNMGVRISKEPYRAPVRRVSGVEINSDEFAAMKEMQYSNLCSHLKLRSSL